MPILSMLRGVTPHPSWGWMEQMMYSVSYPPGATEHSQHALTTISTEQTGQACPLRVSSGLGKRKQREETQGERGEESGGQ